MPFLHLKLLEETYQNLEFYPLLGEEHVKQPTIILYVYSAHWQ